MAGEVIVKPWGFEKVLVVAVDYKIKEITVKPGARLSYQSHEDRNENWTLIAGEGLLTLDGYELSMKKDDFIQIFAEQKHRIKNTSAEHDLVFVEIQTGDYCGDDDIRRWEDDFGRS